MTNLTTIKKRYHDAILEGMARTLWVMAWANWVEEEDGRAEGEEAESDYRGEKPDPGKDWDSVAPETPEAALLAANALTLLIIKSEGLASSKIKYPLAELFELAVTIDQGTPFEFTGTDGPSEALRKVEQEKFDLAEEFGGDLAHMGLGSGVSWSDDHRTKHEGAEWKPARGYHFECSYDGEDLTWSGGQQHAQFEGDGEPVLTDRIGDDISSYGQRQIIYVNENDRDSWRRTHSYLLWFGQVGTTYLLVWSDNMGDAVDVAIDWLVDNAPGYIVDEQFNERFQELQAAREKELGREPGTLDWTDDNEELSNISQEAEEGFYSGGNAGNHIDSDEFGLLAEDPSRLELLRIAGLIENPAKAFELRKLRSKVNPKPPKEPKSDIDAFATILFKDSITGRMFRTLMERGEMTQADFMRLYMTRCERTPSAYTMRQAQERGTEPKVKSSSFGNNFGRYAVPRHQRQVDKPRMLGSEEWPWLTYPYHSTTRNERVGWVLDQVRVQGGRGADRPRIEWVGPAIETLLHGMSNDMVQKAFELVERQMLAPRATDNSDETTAWIGRLQGEIARRGQRNPKRNAGADHPVVAPAFRLRDLIGRARRELSPSVAARVARAVDEVERGVVGPLRPRLYTPVKK